MQFRTNQTVVLDVKWVEITLPVNYGEDDMPNDAPLRTDDTWRARIEVDTGRIVDWPQGRTLDFYMKVTDSGVYELLNEAGRQVAIIDGDYVPHGLIPGEYGDYVDLKIGPDGIISNWPKIPSLSDFSEYTTT